MRVGAQAAGHIHPKSGPRLAVLVRGDDRDDADVVEHGLAAVGVAAREVDLELPGKPLGDRVAHEVLVGGLGPRRDVQNLIGARAGQMAAADVAHRVPARLPRREAHAREQSQHVADLVELHVVHLQVLAGGDVRPAAAVVLGEVADHLELLRLDRPVRHLDAHHLVVSALALAVDAVGQPVRLVHVGVDPAVEVLLGGRLP